MCTDKTIISSDALDKLEVALKKCIHAKVVSRSKIVMHVKSSTHYPSLGWHFVVIEAFLGTSKYSVLFEE